MDSHSHAPADRTVLVGAPRKTLQKRIARQNLDELARLADTAGGEVTGVVSQWIDQPHPRFYIGRGKVDELRERVRTEGANLVIFDDELTPVQGKAIEDRVGVRVMDRSELILDIFATRARTSEAKMQGRACSAPVPASTAQADVDSPLQDPGWAGAPRAR